MDKKPSEKAEALAKQLQEKLRKERPRWMRWVPLLAVALFGSLGILAWLLYPEPEPPPLTLAAMDSLAAEGEAPQLRAYLGPEDPEATVGNLAGLQVLFSIPKAGGEEPLLRKAATDLRGEASASIEPGLPGKTRFEATFVALGKKQKGQHDGAAIYVVASDAPLLLVDVEETLADIDAKLWSKTNSLNIGLRPGATEALQTIRAKEKWVIVYLAVGNTPAKEYRRPRGWIGLKTSAPTALPDGPVLGRLHYDSGSAGDARKALLADLRGRFSGPMAAVVRNSEAAEQCVALGIRAIAMGGGDFPAQVTPIKSWSDLPAALAR